MTRLVLGNWKMNGTPALLRSFAAAALREPPRCEAALCVPHPLLAAARSAFGTTALRWGAQDCSAELDGAFTGEVSARLLAELDARYVILGHPERRLGHGETDGQIAAKAQRALAAGLTPVVCIGETAEERDGEQTSAVLRRQLLQLARLLGRRLAAVVLAYAPPWATSRHGCGDCVAPGLLEDTFAAIAELLAFHAGLSAASVRVIYGGSVDARNAGALLSLPGIAGVLVGAASLRPADFIEICKAAGRCGEPPSRPASLWPDIATSAATSTRE